MQKKMKETIPISKESIISMEKEILEAMLNSDIEKLNELIHKDLLFNIPSGQTITKDLDLENYRSGNMKLEDITASKQLINVIGDTAVVSVTITMKGKFINNILDGEYRINRVWKMIENNWKVIAGSSIQLSSTKGEK